jgi:hypothetical protein
VTRRSAPESAAIARTSMSSVRADIRAKVPQWHSELCRYLRSEEPGYAAMPRVNRPAITAALAKLATRCPAFDAAGGRSPKPAGPTHAIRRSTLISDWGGPDARTRADPKSSAVRAGDHWLFMAARDTTRVPIISLEGAGTGRDGPAIPAVWWSLVVWSTNDTSNGCTPEWGSVGAEPRRCAIWAWRRRRPPNIAPAEWAARFGGCWCSCQRLANRLLVGRALRLSSPGRHILDAWSRTGHRRSRRNCLRRGCGSLHHGWRCWKHCRRTRICPWRRSRRQRASAWAACPRRRRMTTSTF